MTAAVVTQNPARAGSLARAVVYAGGLDTHYIRAGRGDAILVVAEDLESVEVQQLVATLSASHLVLAAAPRVDSAAELASWQRSFVEGLGLDRVSVLLVGSAVDAFQR